MTIQQILTKIQNETYGEEVRQAIADGLQLCYDDKVLGGYCPVDDLNNYYSGAAFCTSSVANGPSQSSFIVMSAGDSEHCFQVAINILNINDGYTRKKQNNTWSQWIRLGVSKKIRYWNYDGTELLYAESVSSGGNGTWTGTATKEPTQQYEYTFVGWSTSRNSTAADPNATRNITSNRDVYAAFTSSLRSYYVYFFNGTNLLSTVTVPYGSNALYAGEDPTKASTAQYDYSFVGWNSHNGESSAEANILNDIRDNKTVYAAFAPAVRSYNVYFYNGSELIFTDTVEYGSSAVYEGPDPTKTSTAQYSYAFSGWNTNSQATEADTNALVNVVADRNVYAMFTATIRTYTVRFMNGTTVLQTVENVPYGGTATYTGNTPQHPTEPDEYTFVGFDPDGTNIIGATDCQAVYILNPKTLRYWNYNGTELLHTESVEVGGDGTWNGTSSRASTTEHSYIFLGWSTSMNASVADPNATKNLTADRDVYAAFEETSRSYSVRFYNGSTLLHTDLVQYGENASYVGSAPTKEATAQYTYTFEGWNSQDEQSSAESDILNNITNDKDVYAAFSSTVNSYNVYFYNGSTLLYTDTVVYGSTAAYSGSSPTKASTAQYTYTFEGWNSQDEQSSAEANVLNNITADKTVYTAFSSTVNSYNVYFYNGSTLLYTDTVTYGSNAVYSGENPTKASTTQYDYHFEGWNSQDEQSSAEANVLNNITADKTVYAAFSSTLVSCNVYFYDGSTLLETVSVPYGNNATYPDEEPTKEATGDHEYIFMGWNSQDEQTSAESGILNNITSDKTVYAAYQMVDPSTYIYGIKREYGSSDPAWTRTDSSINLTATATNGDVSGHSDFDRLPIYKNIKRITLDTGDVMVQIPKFYFKRCLETDQNDPSVEYECIKISAYPQDGFSVHPAFMHDDCEQDYIYVGAYLAYNQGRYFQSVPGYRPTQFQYMGSDSIGTYRSKATAKGTNWGLYDISTHSALQILYLIEYATNDSQTAIGKGLCNMTYPYTLAMTGACDSIANLTGTADASSYSQQVIYRGIEDIWGNGLTYLDGVQLRNNYPYICVNRSNYTTSSRSSNYTQLNSILSTRKNNQVTKMGIDSNIFDPSLSAYMFITEAGSSSNMAEGYCDSQNLIDEVDSSHPYSWVVTGGTNRTSEHGLFYLQATIGGNDNAPFPGMVSRLLYIPPSDVSYHKVSFYNGSTLLGSIKVRNGSNAAYPAEPLTKESTEQYDYTFVGWNSQDGRTAAESGVLDNITADKTVYAAFKSELRKILGNCTAGTAVMVNETVSGSTSAKTYIYLGKSEDGKCILLRERQPNINHMYYQNSGVGNYNGSNVDKACINFFSRFPAAVQSAAVNTTLSYQSPTGVKTVSRKCFALSYTEYGGYSNSSITEGGVNFLPALKTYWNTSDENVARCAPSENGSNAACEHWTRTYNNLGAYFVNESSAAYPGSLSYASDPFGSEMSGIRPAISINPNTPVTISSGKTYLAPT